MALKDIDKKILKVFGDKILRANVTSIIQYLIHQYDPESPITIDNVSDADPYCPECGGTEFSKVSPSEIDVVYNDGYICPICGEQYADRTSAQRCCCSVPNVTVCDCCGQAFLDADELCYIVEDLDQYEWWIVDEWVWKSLDLFGEVTIYTDEYCIWGRDMSQPRKYEEAYLDDAIVNLAHEKEILKGEKHSWAELMGG